MAVSTVETVVADARGESTKTVVESHAAELFVTHSDGLPGNSGHVHHNSVGDHCTHAHTFTMGIGSFSLPAGDYSSVAVSPIQRLKPDFVLRLSLRPPIA